MTLKEISRTDAEAICSQYHWDRVMQEWPQHCDGEPVRFEYDDPVFMVRLTSANGISMNVECALNSRSEPVLKRIGFPADDVNRRLGYLGLPPMKHLEPRRALFQRLLDAFAH